MKQFGPNCFISAGETKASFRPFLVAGTGQPQWIPLI